jgi:hypothetical protein
MTRTSLVRRALTLGVALAASGTAFAGPVTDADLRGKTICWSSGGSRSTYGKDGSYNSNLLGHGTWTLAGDALTEHGDNGVLTLTIEKQGETFHMYGSPASRNLLTFGTEARWVEFFGSYCK